jgi:hypothetical protein
MGTKDGCGHRSLVPEASQITLIHVEERDATGIRSKNILQAHYWLHI